MTLVPWNSRFETGIATLDDEHRALFEALNTLAEGFNSGAPEAAVAQSFETLLGYTLGHFRAEELYMLERGYPELAAHQAQHVHLVASAQELRDRHARGRPVSLRVALFLADLIREHIHNWDLRMVDFLKETNRH